MTDTKNEYISKAKEKLDLIDARIVDFDQKGNEKKGEVREEFEVMVKGIKESMSQMELRIEELHFASEPTWQDLKDGAEQAWISLSDAVKKAGERL